LSRKRPDKDPNLRRTALINNLVVAGVALATSTVSLTGCIEDPDCGICDPDRLILESMTGVNYADKQIHVLQSGLSSAQYFIDDIGPCVESEEAVDSPRGPARPRVDLQQLARADDGRVGAQAARQPQPVRDLRLEEPDRLDRGPDQPLQR
jgi:hypothetical protein